MTIIRCKVCRPGPDNMFSSPASLQSHMEEFHNPETELMRELGVEWVDELPKQVNRNGFSLDDRVLKLLENQPGCWMRVWTAKDEDEGKTRNSKRASLLKRYPQLEVKTGRTLNSWSIFCSWKESGE